MRAAVLRDVRAAVLRGCAHASRARGARRPAADAAGGRRRAAARGAVASGEAGAAAGAQEAPAGAAPRAVCAERVDLGQRIAYLDPAAGEHVVAGEWDFVCDARSPGEYEEDHVIGALSTPVLSDEERARVGTLYKQVSPFEARRLGAALVSKNVADILMREFQEAPADARVLVYCWRGGDRSLSLAHTLSRVGFDVHLIKGGWKAYRARVRAELPSLGQYDLRLLRGVTGCQKTKLLHALRRKGAQVIDLEGAANHKGSILGVNVDSAQPSQKLFEGRLVAQAARFDRRRPVFVEGESSLVGQRVVPSALLHAMRAAPTVVVGAPMAERVRFIRRDYEYFEGRAVGELKERLRRLRQLRGGETVDRWLAQVDAGDFDAFVQDMLESHYDPAYEAAAARDWTGETLETVVVEGVGGDAVDRVAEGLLARHDPACLAGSGDSRHS